MHIFKKKEALLSRTLFPEPILFYNIVSNKVIGKNIGTGDREAEKNGKKRKWKKKKKKEAHELLEVFMFKSCQY